MDQRGSNMGNYHVRDQSFLSQRTMYDPVYEQSHQPTYSVHGGYNAVDPSSYLLQNTREDESQRVSSYGQYSSADALSGLATSAYYDPNTTLDEDLFAYEQDTTSSGAVGRVGNVDGYYVDSGHQTGYGEYNQLITRERQPVRLQPMTAEQIQLSQQRLLGILPIQPLQLQSQSQPQPQQSQSQLQLQLQSQSHSYCDDRNGNQYVYSGHPANATLPLTTASYCSPAESSYTSSSTDISNDLEDLLGMPSMQKRSSPPGGGETKSGKRAGKKRKAKKDPNEPQKPVSAYAMFFRDTQAAIKTENPSANFGDLSKIVAAKWESLDNEGKNAYKQKTELARKEYLKQLAAFRANTLSKPELSSAIPTKTQASKPTGRKQQHLQSNSGKRAVSQSTMAQSDTVIINNNDSARTMSEHITTDQSSLPISTKQEGLCTRPGCNKPATGCVQWDGEYCTDECVSKNCREIFNAWVQTKQSQQNDTFGTTATS